MIKPPRITAAQTWGWIELLAPIHVRGEIQVAAATQALVYLFAPLFEEFMDAHETVELVFRTTVSTEQTVDDILEGVADA